MLHDFGQQHGGQGGPCDKTGFMSYGTAPNVWSTCSRADFLALYHEVIASNQWNWCLDGKLMKKYCSKSDIIVLIFINSRCTYCL
jgi:hypothetical protein